MPVEKNIEDTLARNRCFTSLVIPSTVYDDTESNYIRINHDVIVRLTTTFGSSNVEQDVNLTIAGLTLTAAEAYPARIVARDLSELPQNWQPQVAALVSF